MQLSLNSFGVAVPSWSGDWSSVEPFVDAVTDEIGHDVRSVLFLHALAEYKQGGCASPQAFLSRASQDVVGVFPEAIAYLALSIITVVDCL